MQIFNSTQHGQWLLALVTLGYAIQADPILFLSYYLNSHGKYSTCPTLKLIYIHKVCCKNCLINCAWLLRLLLALVTLGYATQVFVSYYLNSHGKYIKHSHCRCLGHFYTHLGERTLPKELLLKGKAQYGWPPYTN